MSMNTIFLINMCSRYFMSEGTYTKNTPEEIAKMMENLAAWADKPVPHPSLSFADSGGADAAASK